MTAQEDIEYTFAAVRIKMALIIDQLSGKGKDYLGRSPQQQLLNLIYDLNELEHRVVDSIRHTSTDQPPKEEED